MVCPLCGCTLRIQRGYVEVTGDQSPEEKTEVFYVQELQCRNPQCASFEHPVQKVRNQLK